MAIVCQCPCNCPCIGDCTLRFHSASIQILSKIEKQRTFPAKQVRTASDVENDAVWAILRDQRRITVAPLDNLCQPISSDARTIETEKTTSHLILPMPRDEKAAQIAKKSRSAFDCA